MKKTINVTLKMLLGVCIGAAGLCHAETIQHTVSGRTETWFISSPIVNQAGWRNYYGQIVMNPGDTVLISAGGCVQTGGHGSTWKRYVDPQGPNSISLYHGVFSAPAIVQTTFENFMTPIFPGSDTWHVQYTVPAWAGFGGTLWLGYQDDNYSDNGYYSHDDGTGDQCKNVGNAWINLTVTHPQ